MCLRDTSEAARACSYLILLVGAIKLGLYADAMGCRLVFVGCESLMSSFLLWDWLFFAARLSWDVHAGTHMEVPAYHGVSLVIR
jgi:hypothetical protein